MTTAKDGRSLLSVEDAGAEPIANAESWIQVYSMFPRHHTEDASGTRNNLLSTCDRATVVSLAAHTSTPRFATSTRTSSSQSLSQAPPPRLWRPTAFPHLRHDASVRTPRFSESLNQPTASSRSRVSCMIAVHELFSP